MVGQYARCLGNWATYLEGAEDLGFEYSVLQSRVALGSRNARRSGLHLVFFFFQPFPFLKLVGEFFFLLSLFV